MMFVFGKKVDKLKNTQIFNAFSTRRLKKNINILPYFVIFLVKQS